MTKKITVKGGPLDGRTYLIPERLTRIDVPAEQGAGHYKVNTKTATWQEDTDVLDANIAAVNDELEQGPPGGPINTEAFEAPQGAPDA